MVSWYVEMIMISVLSLNNMTLHYYLYVCDLVHDTVLVKVTIRLRLRKETHRRNQDYDDPFLAYPSVGITCSKLATGTNFP